MSQLRATILAESQKIANKSRFGLFSQPPPIALGDDSPYKVKQHQKGQDGKPITKPRNLLGGTNRTGMGKKGYFGVPDSIYKGDPYEDQFKTQIKYERKMHSKSTYHQTQFKPASGSKTLAKSSYEYVQQKVQTQKKRKLNEGGRVWTQPRNVTTNTMSKIERQFMKNPEYMEDPIDRKHLQQLKDKQIWRSKLPEASWKFAKSSIGAFGKDKVVYGEDEEAKQLIAKKKQPRHVHLKTVAHEARFVPAMNTMKDTIGRYPTAMSAQSLQTLRPKIQKDKKQQEGWRPNGIQKSKPTPSISLNRKNICIARYK